MKKNFYVSKMGSPVGPLHLVASDHALCAVLFDQSWAQSKREFLPLIDQETPVLKKTKQQLIEYFKGKRQSFDVPLELVGTEFQKKVWQALSKIPYGQTRSYKQQAIWARSPKAVRAVGQTNGRNRICIILPCHRVVGSDGSLTGYAEGLNVKKFLLNLEGIQTSQNALTSV